MDWYYPVLCGALEGAAADARLDAGVTTYLLEGLGVRCVSTNDWVTAAETAECAMALDALGRRDEALSLLAQTAAHRRSDGSYFTGLAYPSRTTFPGGETTSYTAAAVVLAADALSSTTPAAGLFRGERLARRARPRCRPVPGRGLSDLHRRLSGGAGPAGSRSRRPRRTTS